MLSKLIKFLGGDPNQREIERLTAIAEQINTLEPRFEQMSDDELRAQTAAFQAKIQGAQKGIETEKERRKAEQDALNEILPEAFATVREAAKRTIGQRHYDVQLIGGMTLHYGRIAEMRTGEGKTLVGTLPIYLNALTGRGIHLITVNDYLARLHGRWMAQIYNFLGLSVGILQMAAVTDNGKKAFVVDLEKESPREDQNQLRLVDRREAYAADITYGTNAEFGFDYLRDNMVYKYEDKVQRGHYYAIIDEVDNVLIDEARTPLIISGPAQGDLEWYGKMSQIVRQLRPEDYEVEEKDRTAVLTDVGIAHVEELLGQPLRDLDRPEDVTPEQARLLGYLEQAMRAQFLFRRNKDYLVQGGKVVIVDEFTGRQMPGRRWSDGLHQAVEAKEGVKVEPENITYATITLQNYFRMYQKLAGMTGTALTESEEFHKIYKLDVLPIPTHMEYQASRTNSTLVEVKSKDEMGYQIVYFARRDDPNKTPRFWRRTDYPDAIYRTVEAKLRAIVMDIIRCHALGRPVLVGTTSVENSDRLSGRLRAEPVRRLLQIRLLRQRWFDANKKEEDGHLYKEIEPLYKSLDEIDVAALRQFAKPLNINSINPEDPENLNLLLGLLRLEPEDAPRLKMLIQGGVAHEVLNARKHTEESQIIAGAGGFGAVTIATNMAGRGVDIKLGGELAEEVSVSIARVLKKAGYNDPYDMRPQEQREALLKLSPAEYGIYDSEVKFFLQYFDDMERVRSLGGLHVIGSERHEARRIDNQLRGRSARQGDPGSSRFYLSLEDDLMRMFGGQQVNDVMQRFRLDDDFPMEMKIVGNIIEGSQHRVEGSNFDMRKHLLEYDDVLNAQRSKIYGQRDRVFLKDDLSEDLEELLHAEIVARAQTAMSDPEGPWKLLSWLEQIQTAFLMPDGSIYPSYSQRLLLNEIDKKDLRASIHKLVRRAIEAEEEHLVKAIEAGIQAAETSLENQLGERMEAIETFLDGLKDAEEPRRAQELLEELGSLARVPVKLTPEQLRALQANPASLQEPIQEQVENQLTSLTLVRLLANIELRLGENFPSRENILRKSWNDAAPIVKSEVEKMLETRLERLAGENGQILRELDALLAHPDTASRDDTALLRILGTLPVARRSGGYDAKTHRVTTQQYERFHYTFLASQLLTNTSAQEIQENVLEHLENTREAIEKAWQTLLWNKAQTNNQKVSGLGLDAYLPNDIDPEAPVTALNDEQAEEVQLLLARKTVNDYDRRVLLSVISELWVDYLTKVEALRVSIGLEAYGQRDPLVQYKTKASQMFQTLMADIRAAAVTNMFKHYPRIAVAANPESERPQPQQQTQAAPAAPAREDDKNAKAGRKRHKK